MAGTYTSVTLTVDVTGEKADVLTLLEDQRAMFLVTLRDLDDEQARRRSTVSELTLGGLLKHLTMVQREHTQTILDRDPNSEIHMENLEHGYELTDGETLEEWLTAYRDAALAYDAVIAEVGSLDELIPQATAPWQPEREWWTVRKMALHMLRETAHHSGHADIIREALDGRTTMAALFDFGDQA
ncbi:DinB family protein [Gordonia polyisoprenivorans]|uniref:DinB family protein n=1 Tax=Gordonia polyisoprenivorans TaxID=84595 RepID=UPI001AD69DF2|nr:DinB family protein [Gordonia polyisoprenivorans]QTI69679.1 DinB family protein [Gordonia polyisoprenivorans]